MQKAIAIKGIYLTLPGQKAPLSADRQGGQGERREKLKAVVKEKAKEKECLTLPARQPVRRESTIFNRKL